MIGIDRKVARAILALSKKSYTAVMRYDSSSGELQRMSGLRTIEAARKLSFGPDEVEYSLARLIENGYLQIEDSYMGGYTFHIAPPLRHRFAFFVDAFTKKFWGGFATGLATGLAANLLTGFGQNITAAVSQWLQHLR